jgi:hypothetical protein
MWFILRQRGAMNISLAQKDTDLRAIPQLAPVDTTKSSLAKFIVIIEIICGRLQFLERKNSPCV